MSQRPLLPRSHLVGPAASAPRVGLLGMVRQRARERRYSERTVEAYVYWIRRFVLHHGRRHPKDLRPSEVRAFLAALTTEQQLSASSHNQALAALTFLYVHVLRSPFEHSRHCTGESSSWRAHGPFVE